MFRSQFKFCLMFNFKEVTWYYLIPVVEDIFVYNSEKLLMYGVLKQCLKA